MVAEAVVDRYTTYDDLPQWLSIREAAKWKGVSDYAIREQLVRGELRGERIGRLWRIPKEALK